MLTGLDDEPVTSGVMAVRSAMDQVLQMPHITSEIMGYLDDGSATGLVKCLKISRGWFHLAAAELCGRVLVPTFEFAETKHRYAKVLRDKLYGSSSSSDEPFDFRRPPGTTSHMSLPADHLLLYAGRYMDTGREASDCRKAMYTHSRVMMLDQHVNCSDLAKRHPLPNLRTVIVRGGVSICNPIPEHDKQCSILPTHPFRLVLDGLSCPALMCKYCTSTRLLTPHVETIVLKFPHEFTERYSHEALRLPSACRPKRLVILFAAEQFRKEKTRPGDQSRRGQKYTRRRTPAARKPEHEKITHKNWFFRIASAILAVPDGCEILIVGADQAALYIRNLQQYDDSLPGCRAKPQRMKPALSQRSPYSYRNDWISDASPESESDSEEEDSDEQDPSSRFRPELRPYSSQIAPAVGLSNTSNEAEAGRLPIENDMEHEQVGQRESTAKDSRDFKQQVQPPSTLDLPVLVGSKHNKYACYSKTGHLVSSRLKPGRIPADQVDAAKDLIRRKVTVIESVLRAWVDNALDRTRAEYSWEAEKDAWEDRHDFERYHRFIRAEKAAIKRADEGRAFEATQRAEGGRVLYHDDDIATAWYNQPIPPGLLDTWEVEMGFAPTKAELQTRRKMKQDNISFITHHRYHQLEGNNDEIDDPSLYL